MTTAIRALQAVALLLVVAFPASWRQGLASDEPGREGEAHENAAKTFAAYAKTAAESYELRAGDRPQRKLTLVAAPVLRWSNPLDSARGRGEIFLWTDGGLPAAVLSLNEYYDKAGVKHEQHEWCSFADGRIAAEGPYRWGPTTGMLARELALGAEAPADTATRRLRQMNRLARDFTGEKTTHDGVTRTLRLLAKPIYRYPSVKGEVLDGAIFALVEATDPEALVLLEARRSEPDCAWHYAFARMTSVGLSASYREARVWEAPELEGREVYGRSDKPYVAFIAK